MKHDKVKAATLGALRSLLYGGLGRGEAAGQGEGGGGGGGGGGVGGVGGDDVGLFHGDYSFTIDFRGSGVFSVSLCCDYSIPDRL